MNNLATIIGKNIASLRKAKGLTQQDLALEVHYSDKSISKWELGYAAPSIDILMEFARFFGVTVDYLLVEHSAEAIQEVVKTEEDAQAQKNARISKALILAMSMTFCVLVAVSFFFSPYFFSPEKGVYLWQAFVWLVPGAVIVAYIETRHFYRSNHIARVVLISLFIWTLLVAFAIQFAYGNAVGMRESVWFILAVGVPLQVIIILYAAYGHYK